MTHIKDLLQNWSIECIIFDLDGTLIDTLDKHIKAFEILFNKLAIRISYDAISANMGRTPKDTLKSLVPELVANSNEKLSELANKKEAILTDLLTEVPIIDGALDLLDYLDPLAIPLCLASSTPRFNVIKMTQIANLKKYFQVMITGEDIVIGKPNPEVFLKAAKQTKAKPERCLVIGDSPHDILADKNAGMKIIAVTTGKHSKALIEQEKPDLVVENLKELLNK